MSACPCCESPKAALAASAKAAAGRLFQRCAACGHVWSFAAAPSAGYYQTLIGRNATDEASRMAKLEGRIKSLRGLLRDGMKILEVGCAEGQLGSRIRQDFQLHYVGIEPSRDAETARAVLDKVYASRAELTATQLEVRFDLILCFHVLEHITDIGAELAAWSALCASKAQLLIEVPHEAGHPLLGLDRNLEHLHQFTSASLNTLLHRCGFTVLELSTGHFESEVYPDSLRLLARPSLSPAQREAALLIRLERLFPAGFVVYGIGGDFHNYLLPLLPLLAAGRLRALHDSNAERCGECLPALPDLPITAFNNVGLPVLISTCRFASTIREQLKDAGTPYDLLFDLSDLLGQVD